MSGLVVGIVNYEMHVSLYEDPIDINVNPNANKHPRNDMCAEVSKFVMLFTTIMAICCLYKRYYYRQVWLNKHLNKESEDPNAVEYIQYMDEMEVMEDMDQ
jgi:hypothetical protein